MPHEEKVYPVENTYSDQESDGERVYVEKQIPLAMTISKNKVLYEFRCKVEDAIQNNYIFKKEPFHFTKSTKNKVYLNELRLWGVPLLPSKGHESTDVVLLKFLEARQFKLSEAFKLLQRTLKWRMEMDMEQILQEKLGSDLEELGHIGNTKAIKGHSVCYKKYGIYKNKDLYKGRFDSNDKYEDYLRWNIQFMERCVQTLDFRPGGTNSIISIIDLKDAPAPLIKELPTLHKKTLVLFQDYYPGIIDRHVIVNAPLWLLTFHALQLRTLTQINYGKFVFVRPLRVSKTLLKLIAPENLPVEYGGLKQEHDELFTSHKTVLHQKVKPGSVECIQIPVDKAGMTVSWDLTVVGFEVSYKGEFIPNDDCSYQVLIQREKKFGKTIRNSFHVREPGKIVLHIRNTTYKNKMVFCRHLIQPTVTNFTLSKKI
ncbi:putative CRAL-TRIO lipid binding domain, GOLD domain, CRAL/TRIO domain-containing protein [Heracleum sosnowskyi]|uniref:CRAL-TRIO lipid binding domain, GOLD domain, CRAL/TRIO domain-containing protein n=1 Tax=Heracleum sosnowskyi TaxID=360622 RepID=A0AAD8M198_9APIA|nr:putative CRAL-TRIO lipid binding domain, GOLD domain, CRAL/TRIO domain-containing protein [Heracleum sosnowskyi]